MYILGWCYFTGGIWLARWYGWPYPAVYNDLPVQQTSIQTIAMIQRISAHQIGHCFDLPLNEPFTITMILNPDCAKTESLFEARFVPA